MGKLRAASLACLLLLGAGRPERLPAAQVDALLKAFLEAPDGAAAKAALKRITAEKGTPLADWAESIRRLPAPPALEAKDGLAELALPLPARREVRCLAALPPGYDPSRPWPLLIACHGTLERAEASLARWRGPSSKAGFLLACPDFLNLQTREQPAVGWTFGEEERAIPLAALAEMKRRFRVDEDRVFLTGMSKGGHAAWDLGLRYPQLFAGIVPEASRPYNHGLPTGPGFDYLENALGLGVYHIQPGGDRPEMTAAVREACRLLIEKGMDATYVEIPGRERGASPEQRAAAMDWMARRSRCALPRKAFCRCHDLKYARRAWIEITRFAEGMEGENAPLHLTAPTTVLPPPEIMAREEARVLKGSARLSAEVSAPNEVSVDAERVREIAVYLSEDLFDLSHPVRVTVNGVPRFEGKVEPSVETLLRMYARDRDPKRLFAAEIRVKVP